MATGGDKGSVSTLENLSVYLTLDKARTKHDFRQADFGLDDRAAFDIARMFSKCARFSSRLGTSTRFQVVLVQCTKYASRSWVSVHALCCAIKAFELLKMRTSKLGVRKAWRQCRYDTNDDYRLDQNEFEKLCKDTGRDLEREEAREVLRAIDADDNGCIEFSEFVRFWTQPQEAVDKVKSRMSELDSEGDQAEREPAALQAAEKKA